MQGYYGFCVHVQVGTGSCYALFDNPGYQASSHFWCSASGALEQYVDTAYVAWAEMAGNGYYISCETEGVPATPLTDAQIASLAKLYAWLHEAHGIAMQTTDHGGAGITTHSHYPSGVPDPAWGNHPCPGPLRLAQIRAVLNAAEAILGSRPILEVRHDMAATDPETGGSWWIRADGSVYAEDGAPYLGGLNTHPEWHAGVPEGPNPAVGIAAWKDHQGTWGYIIGVDGPGQSQPNMYRFPRNGSAR